MPIKVHDIKGFLSITCDYMGMNGKGPGGEAVEKDPLWPFTPDEVVDMVTIDGMDYYITRDPVHRHEIHKNYRREDPDPRDQ